MALNSLSHIVRRFMAKWLLLPALAGLVLGSAIWIGIEAKEIQRKQAYFARTVAQHVNSYLEHSHRHLEQFAIMYREAESTQSILHFLPDYSSSVQAVHLLDPSGRIVESWPQELERADFSRTMQSASLQEMLYLTPPYYSLSQKEIVVGMVVAASGESLLLAELDLQALQDSIEELTRHMQGGFAFLTDAFGNLLAHPDMSRVDEQVNMGNLDIISDVSRGKLKSGIYRRNGKLRLMSATNVQLSNWKVGVSQNALGLFAPAIWAVSLSLAGLLALIGVTALLFDRRLQRMVVYPLSRFTQDLDALEQGAPPRSEPGMSFSAPEDCLELWSLQKNFQTMQQTVRHREAALREREEDLRTTLYSIGDGVIATDTRGRVARMNPMAQELTGWSQEEALGRLLTEVLVLVSARTREVCHNPVAKVLQTGEMQGLANHSLLVANDGREYQISDSASPIRDAQGNLTGVVFVFRDETQKYRQEEALKESERKMQTLLSNLPGMAYRCHNAPEWPMDFVSGGCEELLGMTPEELTSRDTVEYGELIHPEDAQQVWELVQEAVREDRAFRCEYRISTQYGREKWVWEQGRAVGRDDAHGLEVLEGFVTDITEYKTFQEKLNYLSFHDSLTGLYNRNFFEEEMNRLQDGRYSPVGIIICDLDGLKFINDTLGHHTGDEMLITTAELLRENFRASDIIARIGGDEFSILITEADQQLAEQLIQRLKHSVWEYNTQNPLIPLSLSMGFAVSDSVPADMQALFKEADNRMYREKIQREGSARSATVQALTRALEARDFETEGHSERLEELVTSMARALNLSQDNINDLVLLARFHDLGKVGVSDRILFKPGRLTEEEMQEMKKHSEIGHRIALSVPELAPIADWILKHHEWWDGGGYPQGLRGEEIPLPCRILAIADAYDAITSERPYKQAASQQEALQELQRCAGTQFDPYLVEQFIRIVRGEE